MPQYTITPWRNFAELLQVKADIFQPSAPLPPDTTKRQHAAHLIATWGMRGRVPHAVASTGLLIEAQLHHSMPGASAFSVRATYAAAFCRFVTGYCDISTSNAARRSMHDVAAELGMPAAWVDLRHEATHGKLPNITRLEAATAGALTWLWENYWEALGAPGDPADVGDAASEWSPEELKGKLREVLSGFVRKRLREVKAGARAVAKDGATAEACLRIIEMCRGHEERLRQLALVMVETRMIVAADRQLGDPMKGAFLIWTPLILTLTNYQTLFLSLIFKRIISILAEPAYLHPPPDAFREALHAWIVHIVAKIPQPISVGSMDGEKLRSLVVSECILAPATIWTGPLARSIVNEGDDAFKKRWEIYVPETCDV